MRKTLLIFLVFNLLIPSLSAQNNTPVVSNSSFSQCRWHMLELGKLYVTVIHFVGAGQEKKGSWIKIELQDGTTGWIAGNDKTKSTN